MSCVESVSVPSVVSSLTRKVEAMINWDDLETYMQLLGELKFAWGDNGLSIEERQTIRALKERVEKAAIEIAKFEADYAKRAGQSRFDFRPRQLRRKRDELREFANNPACTARLKRELQANAYVIQGVLVARSKQAAREGLVKIENRLSAAEELLTSNQTLSAFDLQQIDAELNLAHPLLVDLDAVDHVKHCGLPRVAKEQGCTPEELVSRLQQRLLEAKDAYRKLKQQHDAKTWQQRAAEEAERRRLADAEAAERRRVWEAEERERECQAEAQRRAAASERLEQVVSIMEKRNVAAGKEARQCLAHLKVANTSAASTCLFRVRQLDGGVPVELQAEYQRVLQCS